MVFVVWAWWDSLRSQTGWAYSPHPHCRFGISNSSGTVQVWQYRLLPEQRAGVVFPLNRFGFFERTPAPGDGEEHPIIMPSFKHVEPPGFRFTVLALPYPLLLLTFALPWSSLLFWRSQKIKRARALQIDIP